MNKDIFLKPPISSIEKAKRTQDFLNFSTSQDLQERNDNSAFKTKKRITKKELIKIMYLRFPQFLANDLQELSTITRMSINSICIELLIPTVKEKLNQLLK
jgi:hypothetical protein